MKSSIFYALVALMSYLMLFIFGLRTGLVYVDYILSSQMFVPPAIIISLTVLSLLLTGYREIETYVIGILVIIYGFFFIGTLPYFSLVPFSLISLITTLAMFAKVVGLSRSSVAKLAAFVSVIVAMFALGSALRVDSGPPAYALAFGSIYDDVLPGGVPLMFTDGIVMYTRYFIISVSVPIVILFTSLSVVLTENYYLIYRLFRFQGAGNFRKTVGNAVTVLSCQCEGITASFPSVIATMLFTAIIPLISESILFLIFTDTLLVLFYLKGRRVGFLDRIWNVTSSRGFFALMLASLFIVPLYTLYGVYLSLENNLLFFSSVNVLMFVYGIFIIYLVNRLFPAKKELSRTLTYVLVLLSSVGMFVWYVPQVTLPAVTNPLIFTVMGGISVISGLLSGIVFRWHGDQTKMLYFEFITMMFSMLAIIIFYITAIGVTVIWPEFGVGQQLEFSLLLWGFTLPVMWLSTNLSLNADSRGEDISGTGSFLFTRRMKDQDWGKKSEGTEATQP